MPHRRCTTVKPLLLAGGRSTRLGFPKHLLQMPDGRPLYQHQLDLLCRACPEADTIYVSLGRDSVLDGFLMDVARPLFHSGPRAAGTPGPIAIIYDEQQSQQQQQSKTAGEPGGDGLGPAAGLLAAREADPDATWLVLGCGRPLLAEEVLHRLRDSYEPPVTCVRDLRGGPEPLVAMWSPEALRELAARAEEGALGEGGGLASVVSGLGGTILDPLEFQGRPVMMSVETEADWDKAYRLASEAAGQGRLVAKGSAGRLPVAEGKKVPLVA